MTLPGCTTCTDTGRRGSCSPGRCYCGHEDCHAFASWKPLPKPLANVSTLPAAPTSSAWDDREESTWIDKM